MEAQDYTKTYERRTDEELLRLALHQEELTSEAVSALRNELARRSISSNEQLNAFREQENLRSDEESKNPGRFFLIHPYGIGRKLFGKAACIYNPETGMERFKTTAFIVLFWIPLIPRGTYLVERKRSSVLYNTKILERLPIDWEQVLKVWIFTGGGFLALIWLWKFLWPFLLEH